MKRRNITGQTLGGLTSEKGYPQSEEPEQQLSTRRSTFKNRKGGGETQDKKKNERERESESERERERERESERGERERERERERKRERTMGRC